MRRPTYKEMLEKEKAALAASGLVSKRYAGISNIEFRMTYYWRGPDPVLMTRTLNFGPSDSAGFHLKCMQEGCVNGGYNLAPVVAAMVKGRKKSVSEKLFCHGTNDTLDHASIAYEVSIRYS